MQTYKPKLQKKKQLDAWDVGQCLIFRDELDLVETLAQYEPEQIARRHTETAPRWIKQRGWKLSFPSFYKLYMQGAITATEFNEQQNVYHRHGSIIFHVESAIVHSAYKYLLKNRNIKFLWDDYYKSILLELPNPEILNCLQAAKKFNAPIYFVSTTPVQYKEYVEKFLEIYEINGIPTEVYYKKRTNTTDRRFLARQMTNLYHKHNGGYLLFNDQVFRIGWSSMLSIRTPWRNKNENSSY